VSDPTNGKGLADVGGRLMREEGLSRGFYSGFGPILFKQIPYTMAKFAVQGAVADGWYSSMNTKPSDCGKAYNMCISLGSGTIAGVVAAIISHPADTLLSKVNKAGAGGDGAIPERMMNITKETGVVKLCTQGLGARCVMIGTLTALQFGIFDVVMGALGASKFHFHAPDH
jgi:solute carrier family 25 phosphate transporter 3